MNKIDRMIQDMKDRLNRLGENKTTKLIKRVISTTQFRLVSNEELERMAGKDEIILYLAKDTWICEKFINQTPGMKVAYFYGEIRNAYSKIQSPRTGVLRSLANKTDGLKELGYSGVGFNGKEGKYIPDITSEKIDRYFRDILEGDSCLGEVLIEIDGEEMRRYSCNKNILDDKNNWGLKEEKIYFDHHMGNVVFRYQDKCKKFIEEIEVFENFL